MKHHKHSDAITVVLLSSYRSLGLKLNAAACYGRMGDVCVGRWRGRIRLEALVEMDGWISREETGRGGRMLEKVLIERLIRRPGKPDRSITNTHTRSSSVQEGHRASINPVFTILKPTCTLVSQTEARDPRRAAGRATKSKQFLLLDLSH